MSENTFSPPTGNHKSAEQRPPTEGVGCRVSAGREAEEILRVLAEVRQGQPGSSERLVHRKRPSRRAARTEAGARQAVRSSLTLHPQI